MVEGEEEGEAMESVAEGESVGRRPVGVPLPVLVEVALGAAGEAVPLPLPLPPADALPLLLCRGVAEGRGERVLSGEVVGALSVGLALDEGLPLGTLAVGEAVGEGVARGAVGERLAVTVTVEVGAWGVPVAQRVGGAVCVAHAEAVKEPPGREAEPVGLTPALLLPALLALPEGLPAPL